MLQQQKHGAIYCRLSRDDGGDSESNSIGNQREMLRQYAKDKGIVVKYEYVDDGVSGVTFDRSGFKQLIEDIEAGKIGVLLVKDLSRLGRNNALVAYYTEIVFQDYGVRFICVNDGFDSDIGDNEIMGFKSVINEFYARDISKKIRSSFKTMAMNGKFRGSIPPYGYMRDPQDRHRFVVNPETAPNVKEMFDLAAEGVKPYHISVHLNDKHILSPLDYRLLSEGKESKKLPTEWSVATIFCILKNRQYCGHLISQKQTTQSFKSKKTVYRPESEWVICENTHEPLVDEKTFDKVQSLIKRKKRTNISCVENIFLGLLKCPTCGYGMCYSSPRKGESCGYYLCNLYRRHSRVQSCTTHFISINALNTVVLRKLQRLADFTKKHKDSLDEFYNGYLLQGADLNNRSNTQELEKHRKRIRELDFILKKIVEQNALGALTDERFATLSMEYETEHRGLCEKIENLQVLLSRKKDNLQNAEHFITALGKYTEVTELSAPMLHELVEKIEVHQAEGTGKNKTQKVDIYCRFIGLLPD